MVIGWIVSITLFVVCGLIALSIVKIINGLDRPTSIGEDSKAEPGPQHDLSTDGETKISVTRVGAIESTCFNTRSGGIERPDTKPQILLVEPDEAARGVLHAAASAFAHVESHGRFDTARARLNRTLFDFLVTNVRLGAYNGLHLVYLRGLGPGMPRAIVYSAERDPGLAREVQRARAFYETHECLPVTLGAYLRATLPDRDRRDPAIPDRRGRLRGGRRCWDLHLVRQVH